MLEDIVVLGACWSAVGFMGGILYAMEAAHRYYPPKKIPLWKECLYTFLTGPVCWVLIGGILLYEWIKGEG